MSWWAYLEDPETGVAVEVEAHSEGGTYAVGGVSVAELNVTYNYGGAFRKAWPEETEGSGVLATMLHGRTGAETVAPLKQAVEALGTEQDSDYWNPTDGNAGHALSILLAWAEQHPAAVWSIS